MSSIGENMTIDGLKDFTINNSTHFVFLRESIRDNLHKTFFDDFSDFYYISCAPEDIENWKNIPEVYNILVENVDCANGHNLEILIGKRSEESKEAAIKLVERHFGKRYAETYKGGNSYIHIVGVPGDMNYDVIEEIKNKCPKKVRKFDSV